MKVENRYILLSALLVILLIYSQLISTSESFSNLARRIRGYNILNNGYKIVEKSHLLLGKIQHYLMMKKILNKNNEQPI